MISYSEMIQTAFPGWQIVRELAQGAYGVTFLVCRQDRREMEAAVKAIEVPSDEEEIEQLRAQGLSDEAIRARYRDQIEKCNNEIRLMLKLRCMPHIVSIEDCAVVQWPGQDIGSCILIRMERLSSLKEYTCDKSLTETQVIQIGIQLCSALHLCHKNRILHRDVKPDNIFINDSEASGMIVKLGDFGLSQDMHAARGSTAMMGSLGYIPPEVVDGKPYDQRADLYSLGITLYRLLNNNRMPFLPERPIYTREDYDIALRTRLNGIALPPAANASDAMNAVLTKACSYKPSDRYRSAEAFRQALTEVLDNRNRRPGWRKLLPIAAGAGIFLAAFMLGRILPEPSAVPAGGAAPAASATPSTVPMLPITDTTSLYSRMSNVMAHIEGVWAASLGQELTAVQWAQRLQCGQLVELVPVIHFDPETCSVRVEDSSSSWRVRLQGSGQELIPCDWHEDTGLYEVKHPKPEAVTDILLICRIPSSRMIAECHYTPTAEPRITMIALDGPADSRGMHSFTWQYKRTASGPEASLIITADGRQMICDDDVSVHE